MELMPYHHLSTSKSCFDSRWLPTHHLGTLSNALNYQSSWGFDGGQKHLSERWRSRQTGSGYILTSFLKLEWIYYESGNLKINLYKKLETPSHFEHQNHPWAQTYASVYSMTNESPISISFPVFSFLIKWSWKLFHTSKLQISSC